VKKYCHVIISSIIAIPLIGCYPTPQKRIVPILKQKDSSVEGNQSYHSNTFTETVITEGMAIIGSDITLEEAKLIALNDARQKALNSLGVFVESETWVDNYRLTKDEIRTITGSIMTSEIMETKKEVVQDVFVLKIKVKFDISQSSLQNSLQNYQDRSKDQRTIKHLIKTIEKLQNELVGQKKGTPETVRIVDEIEFSTKRLGKLLTTKQIINYEIQMQELYKKKIKNYFKNDIFPKFCDDLNELLSWNKVPKLMKEMHKDKLVLVFNGFGLPANFDIMKNLSKYIIAGNTSKKITRQFKKYLHCLTPIAMEYDKLQLKVNPKFLYTIKFKRPVYVYINGEEISAL